MDFCTENMENIAYTPFWPHIIYKIPFFDYFLLSKNEKGDK